MKVFWIYNGLRFLVLLATLAIVVGIWQLATGHVHLLYSLIIAFLVSGVISYPLLNKQREAWALRIDARARKATEAFERLKSREDEPEQQ